MQTLRTELNYLQQEYLSRFVADYTPHKFDALFADTSECEHSPVLLALHARYAEARAAGDEFACACIAFASVLANVADVGE